MFFPERDDVGAVLSQTLKKDVITKPVDALLEIYRKMRPGDPPTVQTAYRLLEAMFFDPRKFDFSRVGRLKFNIKMGKPERDRIDDPLLSAKDFYEVVAYVLKMRKNPSEYQADDIDHLGNRRVRAVGELLENQFRIGLERMERAIKEKMSIHQEMQTTMPRDLINAKPVTAAVREFFGSSPTLTVHGPDQPAFGNYAQTPTVGAGTGRTFARTRGIRSARRSPDSLWPHLPY